MPPVYNERAAAANPKAASTRGALMLSPAAACQQSSPRSVARCRLAAAAARGEDAPGGGGIQYWVIAPEVRTDEVVASLRHSWLRGAGDDARFCVAADRSTSRDPTLH